MNEEQLRIYRELLPGATDEQLEALSRFTESLTETWRDICGRMARWLEHLADALTPVLDALARYHNDLARLEECPNRRVVHLAKHAKKARTRKKNLRRAMRIIEKEGKR